MTPQSDAAIIARKELKEDSRFTARGCVKNRRASKLRTMSIEVPASPKQKDALRAPAGKQVVPSNDSSLELAFGVISLSVLAVVTASADRVHILPPSLSQWLEVGAALFNFDAQALLIGL